jgi:hypothetical protein
VVADEQQLRPGGVDVAVYGGEGGGVGHRGLGNDDQVPGAQPPRGILASEVLGGEAVLGGLRQPLPRIVVEGLS